jgi:hypothetical protein
MNSGWPSVQAAGSRQVGCDGSDQNHEAFGRRGNRPEDGDQDRAAGSSDLFGRHVYRAAAERPEASEGRKGRAR